MVKLQSNPTQPNWLTMHQPAIKVELLDEDVGQRVFITRYQHHMVWKYASPLCGYTGCEVLAGVHNLLNFRKTPKRLDVGKDIFADYRIIGFCEIKWISTRSLAPLAVLL